MTSLVSATAMVMALLQLARGELGPRAPRSVTFSSMNLKHLLSWEPPLVAPRGVGNDEVPLYSVQVLGDGWEVWRDVAGCAPTPRTECDVTEPLADPYVTYRARVSHRPAAPPPGAPPQAAAPGPPQWAYSADFVPSRHTVLGAPALEARGGNGSVEILMTEALTPLRNQRGALIPLSGATPSLVYIVMYWKDGSAPQDPLTVWGGERSVRLEGLEAGTSYCMYAEAWEDAWYRKGATSDVVCATTLSDEQGGDGAEPTATATAATVAKVAKVATAAAATSATVAKVATAAAAPRPTITRPPRNDAQCGGERLDPHTDASGDPGMGWVYGLVAGAALLGFGAGLSLSLCLVKAARRPNSVHPLGPGPCAMSTSPTHLMGPERMI